MLDLASHVSATAAYNGKTLGERLAGRFYTPSQLADEMAEQMVAAVPVGSLRHVSVTDPFCGDGRLVLALLRAAAARTDLSGLEWSVELRDREATAARAAAGQIQAMAGRLGMRVHARAIIGDTFLGDLSPRFDLVITNPPWELIKPDSREMRHLSPIGAETYRSGLRTACERLDARFPDARADNAWGGWGTNLARCGWDLCLRIARQDAIVGLILPATMMGDQSSSAIRRKAFRHSQLLEAVAYPSEARLFERVDQPVVTLTMRAHAHPTGPARIMFRDADRLPAGERALPLDEPAMQERNWAVPITAPTGVEDLHGKLRDLPMLGSLEGTAPRDLWLGRELDETRVAEKLTAGDGFPFVKGRMIARHLIVERPTMSVRAERCASMHSIRFPRAVWRDVARATSRRRMIGTVIPAGWVAGNSLHVACFRDGDIDRTMALHAMLSSLVVEAQVRARLTTGHMSLGVVRQARLPALDGRLVRSLLPLVKAATRDGSVEAELRLEIAIAKAFGLDRHEMQRLLEDFPKLDASEKATLTNPSAWCDRAR